MRLRCGDDVREVTTRETPDGLEVRVDGAPFLVRLEEVAAATFLWRRDDAADVFHFVRDGKDLLVFWRGVAYRLREEAEGPGRAQGRDAAGLTALMPGKVIKVSVAVGQEVAKGDEIMVVEAMKMENAIRAPRSGRVKSMAVQVGDMVGPESILAEIG